MRDSRSNRKKKDAAGRRLRLHRVSTGKRVTPTARDLVWFLKLLEHGPLPSSYLIAFTKGTHLSEKRAKERLTDLFNEDNTPHGGAYLSRPIQQFRTVDSRYHQIVYDLTPASVYALREAGLWDDQQAHRSGPWLHQCMVSCITASVELGTLSTDNLTYLSQSYLLNRAGAQLRTPVRIPDPATGAEKHKDLIPDALFGLRYQTEEGDRYRCFFIEADRSTEPATSKNFNRKSWQRNLLQYQAYLGSELYREHLGLTNAPLLVLYVVSGQERLTKGLHLVSQYAPSVKSKLLFQSWEAFSPLFAPPNPRLALLTSPWQRADLEDIWIDQPATKRG